LDLIDLLQWPAMVVTITAAWLVASRSRRKRIAGFWCFLLSNVLWIAWAWHDSAYALLVLQMSLIVTNVRGLTRNDAGAGMPAQRPA
jgi:hypothetical protein